MNGIISKIIKNAKKNFSMIVLPEAKDCERVLKAGLLAAKKNIAKIIFLGGDEMLQYESTNIKVINPENYENIEILINTLHEKRKSKGMTREEATELLKDYIHFGILLVECGYADGMVAGAINQTAKVLAPSLKIIKAKPDIKTVSTYFILSGKTINNKNKALLFADCGLVIKPTAEQLADITIATAQTCREVLKTEPVVAFLSYTTKSEKPTPDIELFNQTMDILKSRNVDFNYDGELQVDAALDPIVAALKAPQSTVAGEANCLIFPDITAGNIGYKLFQRGGNLTAIGPICQGLNKPVNDLSRGATIDEIFVTIALTALCKKF